MIKAVIFDFFGVLIGDGFDATYKSAGGDPSKDRDFISNQLYLNNIGQITKEEFRDNIAKKLGISGEQLAQTIKDSEYINNELLDYIKNSLKNKYKTAILSNASSGAVDRRVDPALTKECFDEVVVSADVGYIKPQKEIYDLVASKLGVGNDECIFIDDRTQYVDGAKQAGMQVILYVDFDQMKTDLEVLLAKG